MDIKFSASISGNDFGLHLFGAKIRQELFHPTEIQLEFRFPSADANSVFDTAVSDWIGESTVLTIFDQDDSSVSKTYEGIVVSAALQDGWLRLRALSEDHKMSGAYKHKSFVDQQIHDVANGVMTANLSNTAITGPSQSLNFHFLHQYDESDYDFLTRLARFDGCVFYHDGEKFIYQPALAGTATVQLGLHEFGGLQLICSLGNTKFSGAPYDFAQHSDPGTLPVQSGRPTLQSHPFATKIYDKSQTVFAAESEILNKPFPQKPDFEQYVKNQQAFEAGMHIRLRGWTNNPMVAIGKAIECSDDPVLQNKFVVVSMQAEFRDLIYHADFDAAGIDSVIPPPARAASRDYMSLLQPAVVIDNQDPDTLGRVKIQFLWDQDGSACAWARIAHMGAGNAYGTHFIPRMGDHVLAGFEHGDPSLPIVLGALYHSESKPDFVTNNGIEEVLVVKTPQESTIRVIDTQGSEEIVISMKDNKNLIHLELSGPKITIESVDGTISVHSKNIEIKADEKLEMSAKDIEITATNNMKTDVSQKIETTSGSDFKLSVGGKSEEQVSMDKTVSAGMKLSQSAGTEAELAGTVSVKLSGTQIESSAAATNTIKGAIVQIN